MKETRMTNDEGRANAVPCPGLPRSRWDMLQSVYSTDYFPLTLALSLREREQQASDSCLADGCWVHSGTSVIETRWTILPLPKGEGRGEGNRV